MTARGVRHFLALALIAALACGCSDGEETPTADEQDAGASHATPASGIPRLVDLGSDSCGPCKAMSPILDEMRETFDGQFAVEFIDVRKDRDAVTTYGVKLIPTQVFLDADGNELFRHEGFFSREDILATWREHGYEFEG